MPLTEFLLRLYSSDYVLFVIEELFFLSFETYESLFSSKPAKIGVAAMIAAFLSDGFGCKITGYGGRSSDY